MRDYLLVYINGHRHEIRGEDAFHSLSDYLRKVCFLTGTKVVCAEGDCGACTVLKAFPAPGKKLDRLEFSAINSCITFMYLLDCCHIITVEGVRDSKPSEVQACMMKNNGAQCGFCTPGFVMALTGLYESKEKPGEKHIRNALTGNLCRCTGYANIIDAGLSVDMSKEEKMADRYHDPLMLEDLQMHQREGVSIDIGHKSFHSSPEMADALKWKSKNQSGTVFSSATDLGVQINKDRLDPERHLGLNLIPELHEIKISDNVLHIGSRVTLTKIEKFVEEHIPELARLLRVFASPQIKNIATLTGNVVNASPIGDTLPALLVLEAQLIIAGNANRAVSINQFYQGYKQMDLKGDELVTKILIPLPDKNEHIKIYKVSKRKDLDISAVNAGMRIRLNGNNIEDIKIAYGGVGPTVLRLPKLESSLKGKSFVKETFDDASLLVKAEISPMSDVRGSKEYRYQVAENLMRKFYHEVEQEVQL